MPRAPSASQSRAYASSPPSAGASFPWSTTSYPWGDPLAAARIGER